MQFWALISNPYITISKLVVVATNYPSRSLSTRYTFLKDSDSEFSLEWFLTSIRVRCTSAINHPFNNPQSSNAREVLGDGRKAYMYCAKETSSVSAKNRKNLRPGMDFGVSNPYIFPARRREQFHFFISFQISWEVWKSHGFIILWRKTLTVDGREEKFSCDGVKPYIFEKSF